jgi:hypothetical protein
MTIAVFMYFLLGQRDAFAAAEGDPACGVAERLTRKGWPLAANPWRALRKCNVARMLTLPIAYPLTPLGYWIPDSGVKPRSRCGVRKKLLRSFNEL